MLAQSLQFSVTSRFRRDCRMDRNGEIKRREILAVLEELEVEMLRCWGDCEPALLVGAARASVLDALVRAGCSVPVDYAHGQRH